MADPVTTPDLGILAILPTLVNKFDFWSGFVLGMQEDPFDNTSQCYTSFAALKSTMESSNLEFTNYKSSAGEKGETATDTGFFLHLAEIGQDFGIVWFNLYTFCQIEQILIQWGRIAQSEA